MSPHLKYYYVPVSQPCDTLEAIVRRAILHNPGYDVTPREYMFDQRRLSKLDDDHVLYLVVMVPVGTIELPVDSTRIPGNKS